MLAADPAYTYPLLIAASSAISVLAADPVYTYPLLIAARSAISVLAADLAPTRIPWLHQSEL